jgi:hypothetical protein
MKLLLYIFAFVLLSGVAVFAQEDSLATRCIEVNDLIAMSDIQNDSAKLLVKMPYAYLYEPNPESVFKEKYKITLYDFGCLRPDYDCMISYNFAIFRHLDKKYGKGWRDDLDFYVIGFKEYIAEN